MLRSGSPFAALVADAKKQEQADTNQARALRALSKAEQIADAGAITPLVNLLNGLKVCDLPTSPADARLLTPSHAFSHPSPTC